MFRIVVVVQKMKLTLFALYLLYQVLTVTTIKSVVIWHGLNECSEDSNPQLIAKLIKTYTPKDTVIKMISIGSNCKEDTENSVWMNTFKQIELVGQQLSNDVDLRQGFTAIGISQGGLLFRALIQLYDNLKLYQLISIGGPQQGVYGIPDCWSIDSKLPHFGCTALIKLQPFLKKISPILATPSLFTNLMKRLEKFYAPASYWQDPLQEPHLNMLGTINNIVKFNSTYRDNLIKLKRLVLIKFTKDESVKPFESESFGFYAPGSYQHVVPFNETILYLNDTIGLKALSQQKRIFFHQIPNHHLHFDPDWFVENIIKKYIL